MHLVRIVPFFCSHDFIALKCPLNLKQSALTKKESIPKAPSMPNIPIGHTNVSEVVTNLPTITLRDMLQALFIYLMDVQFI
jgi:hypothetical protein